MEFEIEDTDFAYNLIVSLRNQLVNGDDRDLREIYSDDEDCFLTFLFANYLLKEVEPEFYLIDSDYCNKVSRIIGMYRNRFDGDVNFYINDIIYFFNRLKSLNLDAKKKDLSNYIKKQQDLRRVDFDNKDEFIRSLGYDGVVLQSLYDNSLDNVSDDDLFLMSINYFLEVMPSLFLDDDNYNLVREVANRYKSKLKFYQTSEKRYVNDTISLIKDTNSFYHEVLQKVK